MSILTPSAALEVAQRIIKIAQREPTDDNGLAPVAVAVFSKAIGTELSVVRIGMDGVRPASLRVSDGKGRMVFEYDDDTLTRADERDATRPDGPDWELWNVLAAQAVVPGFVPLGGGIRLLDLVTGETIGALAVSGRSQLGDHKLAMWAACDCGLRDPQAEPQTVMEGYVPQQIPQPPGNLLGQMGPGGAHQMAGYYDRTYPWDAEPQRGRLGDGLPDYQAEAPGRPLSPRRGRAGSTKPGEPSGGAPEGQGSGDTPD